MAITHIKKGTELTLCYLKEKDRFSDVEKRRNILKNYGFVCKCELCTTEEEMDEEPYYLIHYWKLERSLDSCEELGSTFLEKELILASNHSKVIWRILNLENALHNIDPSSQEHKLIFERQKKLKELVQIQGTL